jgi:pSer/pThr/pTyr-binding forkhead associated (FHA) protein
VPSIYHVYLRHDDHERLEGIFNRITGEAKRKLDDELKKLNEGKKESSGVLGTLSRWFGRGGVPEEMIYESAEGQWYISFLLNTDDVAAGSFDVTVELAMPVKRDTIGPPTKRITFRRDSRGETRKIRETVEHHEQGEERGQSAATDTEEPTAYAQFTYEDARGKHVYQMTKNNIVIGRGGLDHWVDLRLHTDEDVSREHLRLRRDPDTGKFYVKDMSTRGTKVNGKKIPTSVKDVNGVKQDIEVEVELPPKSLIELAGIITLDFQATEAK